MTSPTKPRRLFTRSQMEAARAAWDAGEFSHEWRDFRYLAAMEAGLIFPPDGTKWDSWGDDEPSERALLIRAIRDTPSALRDAIRAPGVRSWAAVVAILIRGRDERSIEVARQDLDWIEVKERRPSTRIVSVLTTIADSLGVHRPTDTQP